MSPSSIVKNPLKTALRKRMKDILLTLSLENKRQQSDAVTRKVSHSSKFNRNSICHTCSLVSLLSIFLALMPSLSAKYPTRCLISVKFTCVENYHEQILNSEAFKRSKRISVYLSLSLEVDTKDILAEMFRQQKQVSHLKW